MSRVIHVVMRYDPSQWAQMNCIYATDDFEKAFDYAYAQAIKDWTDELDSLDEDDIKHDDSQYTMSFEHEESDVKYIIDTCQNGDNK